jgi:tRNA pseudouridine38-40 synthase
VRAFRVAYDGRDFHGFQRQPDVPTVADALLDALVSLDLLDAPAPDARSRPTPPGYAAAGRTDAGVSALAQTVAFDAPEWLDPQAFDARLPDGVHVWAAADVPDDFHATHDAERRVYRYHLHGPDLEPDRARAVADRLSGTHDFHNLTPDETGTERTLDCEIVDDWSDTTTPHSLTLRVASDGFPRELVRRLATVVRGVAGGSMDADRIDRLLAPAPVEGPAGVPPAPPDPLVLTSVSYPDVTFERDGTAVASAREAFRTRRRDGLAAVRVVETVLDGL